METLDLSRRGVLLNDEQLGPYPLEKLKRVERLTVDIVEDSPRVDEKEMAFAKCRLGASGMYLRRGWRILRFACPLGRPITTFRSTLTTTRKTRSRRRKRPAGGYAYRDTAH